MNPLVFRFLEWHRRLGLRRMPGTILQWLARREYFVLVRDLRLPLPKVPVDQTTVWTSLTEAEIPQLLAINPVLSETEIRRRWKEGQECSLCWIEGSLAHYRWYATGSVYLSYLGKTLRLLEGECLIEDVFTHPAFRRRGIQSVGSLTTLKHLQDRGFRRAIAIVARYNTPTLRVTQKMGYAVAGAIGYWNVALWKRYFITGSVRLDGRASMYVEHVAPESIPHRRAREAFH